MSSLPAEPTPPAERLRELLERMHGRAPERLDRPDLRALPGLYRRVVSELAEARARGASATYRARLEALVIKAHSVLYVPDPPRLGSALVRLMAAFPAAVRRSRALVGLSAAILVAGTAFGYLEVHRDSASVAVFLPQGMQENAEGFREGAPRRAGDPVYGVFYFTNNARVALTSYALGATFGVGTVLVLLLNGVLLGATFALVEASGSPRAFFSFVLPHGGVELFAIVVAAGAGLRIAQGLLRPGWRRRRDALMHAARESLPLALGAASLLTVAGLVEGWISPAPLGLGVKALIGFGLDLLVALYVLLLGRRVSS